MKSIGSYIIEKEVLGKGQFGTVFRAHAKADSSKLFACKSITRKNLSQRLQTNLKNEINILTKINSSHVVKLYDIQRTENNYYLFMEYCNGGDLENFKDLKGHLTEQEARYVLQQLVKGFQEIYKSQVMHRDLKLANILIHLPHADFDQKSFPSQTAKIDYVNQRLKGCNLYEERAEVKIADLGFSRELGYEDLSQTICGTPLIMAPEVLNGVRYNHKADVWSLGIIFYELITGFTPFTGRDRDDLKKNLEKGIYKLPKMLKMTLKGLDFLNQCLQFDQEKRISWEQLCKHPYITDQIQGEDEGGESLKLSYEGTTGFFVADGRFTQQELHQIKDPYSYFNEKNAILLNCKNPQQFLEVYEKTLEKHFSRQQREENLMNSQINLERGHIQEEFKEENLSQKSENDNEAHAKDESFKSFNEEEKENNQTDLVLNINHKPDGNIDLNLFNQKIKEYQEQQDPAGYEPPELQFEDKKMEKQEEVVGLMLSQSQQQQQEESRVVYNKEQQDFLDEQSIIDLQADAKKSDRQIYFENIERQKEEVPHKLTESQLEDIGQDSMYVGMKLKLQEEVDQDVEVNGSTYTILSKIDENYLDQFE